ncbi:desulfoferrodoxin [archaeon]|jgi:superoxide reductase|nr:desulfoferrodoxin [archaeon]MBT4373896.1 desulfoferrodoxin [archaeon]MBT4532173.1 desulfoferrodoxin [archaeon]MBT7001126.1 desulfoferrodoxin [archaeon]MBT7282015.1 desulfoferrodoxin [archaeon]
MTTLNEIYKCEICGNIIEVLHEGPGTLVCCGKPMNHMPEQSKGKYAEKHAPVIEKNEDGIKVKIGKVEHPMEDKHFIEWIEILTEKGVGRKYLNPKDNPKTEALFPIKSKIKKARMYCNIHGLWKTEF